jgi:hypothetical protein
LTWEEKKKVLGEMLDGLNNEEAEKWLQILDILDKKLKEAGP